MAKIGRLSDSVGLRPAVHEEIRACLKDGSFVDGQKIDLRDLLSPEIYDRIDWLITNLSGYKGLILTGGETNQLIPAGTQYTLTHIPETTIVEIHLHYP